METLQIPTAEQAEKMQHDNWLADQRMKRAREKDKQEALRQFAACPAMQRLLKNYIARQINYAVNSGKKPSKMYIRIQDGFLPTIIRIKIPGCGISSRQEARYIIFNSALKKALRRMRANKSGLARLKGINCWEINADTYAALARLLTRATIRIAKNKGYGARIVYGF